LGVSRVECLVLTKVSENNAVAISKVLTKVSENNAVAISKVFAKTLVNTKHLTQITPESRSYTNSFTVQQTADSLKVPNDTFADFLFLTLWGAEHDADVPDSILSNSFIIWQPDLSNTLITLVTLF
jgi:hypothetical protein